MKKITALLKIPTTKNVIINSVGNILGVFFTAVYFLVLVRVLTRTEYGILSVLFAIAYVMANILDLGVTATIYSYLPPLLKDRTETLKFIKANFLFQTVLSAAILLVLFIFIKPIDKHILKLNVPLSYYFWTFISIPLFIWQNFALNVLYASKKFLYTNVIANIANVIKTAILLFLVYIGKATVPNIIITLGVIGQLLFILPLFYKRTGMFKDLLNVHLDRSKISLNYTITYFFATQFFSLASRVDLFLLSFFLSKASVGDYGLSQKILLTIISLVNSITQVLSPQFADLKTRKETIALFKKSFIYIAIPIGVFLTTIILPTSVYTLLLTDKFVRAAAITRLLSTAFILYAIAAVPTLFFLYTVRKPIHLFYMNLMFLILVSAGCWVTIPRFGVYGPPFVFIGAFIAVLFYVGIAFAREFKTLQSG